MKADFTEEEKEIFKGKVLAIAKTLKCSHTMVQLVISGVHDVNTPLTEKIYNKLKATVEFFTPTAQ